MTNKKTVVKASAGTGKTYRLSLEYIYFLLLGINFKNIVVMTFTKKATFEIKERIFEFIEIIINKKEGYEDLIKNIEKNFDYTFSKNDNDKLIKIYKEMLVNKNNIRIDTIDGLISKIFKSCVSEQILGIYNYEIIEKDSELYTKVYNNLILKLVNDKRFNYKIDKSNLEKIKSLIDYFLLNKEEILSSKMLTRKIEIEDIMEKIREVFVKKYNFKKENAFIKAIFEHLSDYDNKKLKFETLNKKLLELKDVTKAIGKNSNNLINSKDTFSICRDFIDILNMTYIYDYTKFTNEILENAKIVFENEFNVKKELRGLEFFDTTYYTLMSILDEKNNLVKDGKLTTMFFDLIDGNIDAIMIDEFQDTSIIQFKLLKLLMESSKIVTCVGDEKQSIYEWRGGYKKLFEDLDKLLGEDVTLKTLDTCYRSEKYIIDFVNDTFSKLEKYKYNKVKSAKEEKNKGYVKVKKIEEKEEPYEMIVEEIKVNKHFKNTAILLRGNDELKKMSEILERENIKYSLTSNADLLDVDSVKKAHTLVEYLVTKNEIKKYEFLKNNMNYSLNDIKEMIDDTDKKEEVLENFLKNYQKHNSINSSNYDFVKNYLELFGYNGVNSLSTDIINLNEYFKIMKSFSNLEDFYRHIMENKKNRKAVIEKDSVMLLTIHKSKGLEYKNVYTYIKTNDKLENNNIKYVIYDEKYNLKEFKMVKYKILEYISRITKSENEKLSEIELNELSEYFKSLETYNHFKNIKEQKKEANINIAYVAYTRAKENCYIYYSKGNMFFENDLEYGLKNEEIEEIIAEEEIDYSIYSEYFNPTKYINQNYNEYNLKRIIKQKIGSALHYFFEIYNGNKKVSIDMFNRKFANLFSDEELEEIYKLIDENLIKYKEILDTKLEKYPEFKIYDENNQMFKIDLLIVDRKNKKAFIYDYKTGHDILENDKYITQIENYKKILKNYLKDYEINTQLLPLNE